MESHTENKFWIRPEDADHPKLDRLRRAIIVDVGPADDVSFPWVVWGTGLSRTWLIEKLESGGQVLIMPPWMDGGFAGLPPVRLVESPKTTLQLDDLAYTVSASFAVDPSPAWREQGSFSNSKLAWLVSHEPYAGSGQAWLSTAELLVASPSTRPREARMLTIAIAEHLTGFCRRKKTAVATDVVETEEPTEFLVSDIPYLLAAAGLTGESNTDQAAQFISRKIGVEPNIDQIEKIFSHPSVTTELAKPVGSRHQIAQAIDSLGYRSFRLEIEETCHE